MASARLAGFIGLELPTFLPEVMPIPEVGWRLHPDFWGLGLASEGARAVLDDGFNRVGLETVVSIYEPDNVRSGQVMERLGMQWDRDTTHPELGIPLRVYRLDRDQWSGSSWSVSSR